MEIESNQEIKDKMTVLSPHIRIITLNVNGQNSPIKKYRASGWIKKPEPTISCLQETHLSSKDKHRLKVKRWKMILQANGNQKCTCRYTYIRQNILQSKIDNKRQRWELHNDRRDIPPKRDNTY